MSARHWYVLGAGAMGCLFSRQLHAAGCTLTLLLRRLPSAAEATVEIEEGEQVERVPVRLSGVAGRGEIRYLLVTTKAPQVAPALAGVAHRLNSATQVLLAANGMGFLAAARENVRGAQLYCCTTTEGAYRLGPLHIRHAGRGLTLIGATGNGSPPAWLEDWLAPLLDCRWESPIEPALWHKLAINCAINPVTAVYRCSNGALAENPQLLALVGTLCDEIAAVSAAEGFPATAAHIHRDALQVIRATADNRSSMLQDVLAGRPTEIEYLTGHLLRRAAHHAIDTPCNRRLYTQVLAQT